MKLKRKTSGPQPAARLNAAPNGTRATASTGLLGVTVNRRTFLKNSGLSAGGAALAVSVGPSMLKKAQAADTYAKEGIETELKHSICTHCSVGCGVIAEVQNGVWT